MPAKKKKGKASKLARMSDEERTRYYQQRAEMEAEQNRRKQQLIAIFTKNKLRREEAFSRINTAKLNEQWRATLRRIKCSELREDVKFLWDDFENTLQTKDELIKKLYGELIEADFDHRSFQETHMMALDDIIAKGKERINHLHNNYEAMIRRIKHVDLEDMKRHVIEMKDSVFNLRTTIFAKRRCQEKELDELRTRNAINIQNIIFSKEELIRNLKREMYFKMEGLWQKLNEVITDYEISTESKRKQFEYLKEQDDVHQIVASQFPKEYVYKKDQAETLRKNLSTLLREREEMIEDLKMQSEMLNKRVYKMRQEVKAEQTLDEMRLRRLTVLSSEVTKELERILDKGVELQMMSKLCADMEPGSLSIHKYLVKNFETTKALLKFSSEPYDFLKKIEGFRDHLFCIKEDNNLMKRERSILIEENNRLKHSLKAYLMRVSRVPTIRPWTRA